MDRHDERNLIEQMLTVLNRTDAEVFEGSSYDSAHQIKSFIDALPGGFFIYYADGGEELIYANAATLRIFRCDSFEELKELTGNSFKGLVHPDDVNEVEKSIYEQIRNSRDALDHVEYRIICKDGVVRWVEDYGRFVTTERFGDIFYVFISDATEKINRRKAERTALINVIEEYDKERKLIRQEHLQRLEVIEGLSVNYESILYLDLDEDSVLPYRVSTRLEKQFAKMLQPRAYGKFKEDYVKRWVHPEDKNYVAEMLAPEYIRGKFAEQKTYYINFRCIENGEIRFLQLRLVNVGKGDSVSQAVMGFRSVDEEVLQEMEQKKLLEDALKTAKLSYVAKNSFLSNMSHDMRTPLNAIFGYAALAQKNADNPKTVITYLKKIEDAGKNILELVDRVLEISYAESQDFHIDESNCNVFDVVQSVYKSVLPKAVEKNVSLSIGASSVLHHEICADKEKLTQVLLHLVGNAVKFTGSGGKVKITVDEKSGSLNEFALFRFTVKDTGIGISKEAQKRIFEPFEREKNTTHSGVYGSGLGLTIAKHIIEMMGGKIEVESEVGKGSVFTVTLSLRIRNNGADDGKSEENFVSELAGKKILLVEDNEINLEIETEMLEDLGLIVEPAENGKIAVDKLAAAKPDEYAFVLMDIQMPVMDGREATVNIRKLDPPVKDIPVIALSANAFESDRRNSMEAGMNEHLTKPIDIPLLLKTLYKIMNKK